MLAYIVDSVYELAVRQHLVRAAARASTKHQATVAWVRATAQADALEVLVDELDEAEADIVRRGRNCKPLRHPKSATLSEYRQSTGLESLLGYLYLSGQKERLQALLQRLIEINEQDE